MSTTDSPPLEVVECSQQLQEELDWLHQDFPTQHKILNDIGEIKTLINLNMDFGTRVHLSIKYQLDDSYPKNPPLNILLTSKEIPIDNLKLLTTELTDLSNKTSPKPVIKKNVEYINKWILDHNTSYIKIPKPITIEKSKKQSTTRNKEKKSKSENAKQSKLSPMKTADDVIKRIQWDSSVNAGDFRIGYIDRHTGLQERGFTEFTWADLSTLDHTVLAIPRHRIQYFRYRDVIVWDKRVRLDFIFGSGKKPKEAPKIDDKITLNEVVESYDQFPKLDSYPEKLAVRMTAPTSAQACSTEEVLEPSPAEQAYRAAAFMSTKNACSIDTDEEIEMFFGNEHKLRDSDEEFWNESDKKDEFFGDNGRDSGAQLSELYPRDNYWGPKARPTHFVCLHCDAAEIVGNTRELQKKIVEIEPAYHACFMDTARLHITLACLGLDTLSEIERAKLVLQTSVFTNLMDYFNPSEINVTIEGVDHFRHETFYAKVLKNAQFMEIVTRLRELLLQEKLEIRDVFDFNPHMTILKLDKDTENVLNTPYLDSRLYTSFDGIKFGEQNFASVSLCKMTSRQSLLPGQFYDSVTTLNFKK